MQLRHELDTLARQGQRGTCLLRSLTRTSPSHLCRGTRQGMGDGSEHGGQGARRTVIPSLNMHSIRGLLEVFHPWRSEIRV